MRTQGTYYIRGTEGRKDGRTEGRNAENYVPPLFFEKAGDNNIESRTENVLFGVPQGSILGPLLFLMFINDLPLYTNNVSTDLYADDTTLYMIGETQDYIEQNLQIALQNLSEWCKLNGMLLNTEKTKAMLITTSQKRLHLHNDILHLIYNNDVLNSVENEKVLGVRIDNNLTWSIHIRAAN